jgi:hypothetical protein
MYYLYLAKGWPTIVFEHDREQYEGRCTLLGEYGTEDELIAAYDEAASRARWSSGPDGGNPHSTLAASDPS